MRLEWEWCYLDNEHKRDTHYILRYDALPPFLGEGGLAFSRPLGSDLVHRAHSTLTGLHCTCVAGFSQENGSTITHHDATLTG